MPEFGTQQFELVAFEVMIETTGGASLGVLPFEDRLRAGYRARECVG
jgi:hypothetical protein